MGTPQSLPGLLLFIFLLQIFSLRTPLFVYRYKIFNTIIKCCGKSLSIIIWQSRLLLI